MKIFLTSLIALSIVGGALSANPARAQIYSWRDANGQLIRS